MIMTLVQYVMGLLNSYPALCAGVVGVLLSLCATQFFKTLLPPAWEDEKYKAHVRLIGFFSGWLFGYGAWKLLDPAVGAFGDMYYAAGIGLVSPTLYSILVPVAVKRYPFLEGVLSGRPGH